MKGRKVMSHTPGPWEVSDIYEVTTGKGELCIRQFYPKNVSLENIEQAKHNAHLIAAVPELLEACERFVEYYKKENRFCTLGNGQARKSFDEMSLVVKKAKGGK
jgi:hypothetical protein